MERRGRSRDIPQAAIYRMQFSHQQQLYAKKLHHRPVSRSKSRSLSLVSTSPDSVDSVSPQSTTIEPITPPDYALDYYDSPPTPPQSIEDQIYEAYALDNIHLAKVLYLKLKGIEVVDDHDPRIDQVRDEDFPFASLVLDEEDERALKEYQQREQDRLLEQRRINRLAACERVWEQALIRYREDRLKLIRQKEAAFARSEQKRLQSSKAKDTQARPRVQHFTQLGRPRGLLSYKSLGHTRMTKSVSPPQSDFMFEYTVMRSSSPQSPTRRYPSRSPERKPVATAHLTSSCSVPFREVSSSMSGPLFPFLPDEDTIRPDSRSGKRKSRVNTDLLDVLLATVHWEVGERKRVKGKGKEVSTTWSSSSQTLCSACSKASTGTSVSTIVSRPTSWLSFGGRDDKRISSSTSTDSPIFHSLRRIPTIGLSMSSSSKAGQANPPRHSCFRSNLTTVELEDTPLYVTAQHQWASSCRPQQSTQSSSLTPATLVRRLGDSMSTLFGFASQLQAAYIKATVLSFNTQSEVPYSQLHRFSRSRSNSLSSQDDEHLRPVGYRVKADDIKTFVGFVPQSDGERHLPLIPMFSLDERRTTFTSTSISGPPITPSPLKPREPPTSLQYRIRPIANPVLLRLKALQNVCCVGKMEWEGRAKEGNLGFGRERLNGVAYEGIGRSGLAWEVSC